MAIKIQFAGATLRRPGVYTKVSVSLAGPREVLVSLERPEHQAPPPAPQLSRARTDAPSPCSIWERHSWSPSIPRTER